VSSNAVMAAVTRVKGAAAALLAQAKPWSELADRSAFSKPGDLAEVRGDWGVGRARDCEDENKKAPIEVLGQAPTFFSFFRKQSKKAASLLRLGRLACASIRHLQSCGKRAREYPLLRRV
jgi:hypothetical protein